MIAAALCDPDRAHPLRLLPPLPPSEQPSGPVEDRWVNPPECPWFWARVRDGKVVDSFTAIEALYNGRLPEQEILARG